MLTYQQATGKENSMQREPVGSHWEKIRVDFNFGSRDRTAVVTAEEPAAEIDDEGSNEEPDEKKPSGTQEPAAGARIPLFLSLHGLGRQQPDNAENQIEPADAEVDPLSPDKARRPTAAEGTRDIESRGDDKPSPKTHVERAATSRIGGGAATPANTVNVIAGTSAQDATIGAGSTTEEIMLGDDATVWAETSKSGIGSRTSNEILKQSGASRATVSAEQNFPAPALQNVSQTTRDVIDAIAGNGAPARAAPAAATSLHNGSPVAVPAHILKIELHPAELGAVTANLRLAGEQLSIELKPDTYEAHRRLSSDSDAIVKSLKSLGFDIDKVTILQPSIATTPTARTEAPQAGTSLGRDQSSFQPGNSSGNGDGTNGQSGRNRGNDRQQDQRQPQPSQQRAGRGLFI
ncbi:flagellar hook-length control protein FliK [Mesorhizobium amorphae]